MKYTIRGIGLSQPKTLEILSCLNPESLLTEMQFDYSPMEEDGSSEFTVVLKFTLPPAKEPTK